MVEGLCPPLRSVFLRPQHPRANPRGAAAISPPLPRGGTSAEDKLPHCSGSPIAARRIPRCGQHETVDRWGREWLRREESPRKTRRKLAKSAASELRVRPRSEERRVGKE